MTNQPEPVPLEHYSEGAGMNIRQALLNAFNSEELHVNPGYLQENIGTTLITSNGKNIETGGGGIPWNEIPLFEMMAQDLKLTSILIIGNSWGWSTIMFSLLWPEAKVVAMDCGYPALHKLHKAFENILTLLRGDGPLEKWTGNKGLQLTNKIIADNNLNAQAVIASSPRDTELVIAKHLSHPPELVFIDGSHLPQDVENDFNASLRVADKNCIYVLHDVINFNLIPLFQKIKRQHSLKGEVLWRTATGIGVLYHNSIAMDNITNVFMGTPMKQPHHKRIKCANVIGVTIQKYVRRMRGIKSTLFK